MLWAALEKDLQSKVKNRIILKFSQLLKAQMQAYNIFINCNSFFKVLKTIWLLSNACFKVQMMWWFHAAYYREMYENLKHVWTLSSVATGPQFLH